MQYVVASVKALPYAWNALKYGTCIPVQGTRRYMTSKITNLLLLLSPFPVPDLLCMIY